MKNLPFLAALTFVFSTSGVLRAADRPNILWITSEDNAAHWIGCYGNKEASTPRIDALAASGLQFTHAYANGPVCAVARSTILNGAYAVTQGTQHMRSRHPIPAEFKAYVTWLRELGYYCTNNSKTDYNFRGNDNALWDESSQKADYANRPKDKPFFAVFNITVSHESNLFPAVVDRNRKNGQIPETPRLDPAKVTVPPHMPDLPEIRGDIAIYHDCVSAMDRQVGVLLDQLSQRGLADDTIVFYYSDHGGAMARGKRYLQDTGTRVPLVIRVPEKWKHLSPFASGSKVDEPVSFVDLAPTVLSLCGKEKPAAMQGRAFLGSMRKAPEPDAQVFLFADRFDTVEGMRRGLTDGRYRYIRCFSPQLPGAPYCDYPLGQPSWVAWRKAWENGALTEKHAAIWKTPQPVEMLFDTTADPWEIHNLADMPEHAERLRSLRGKLRQTMLATRDTSLVPEPMWETLASNGTIHGYVRGDRFQIEPALDLAFAASSSDPTRLPEFIQTLASPDPVLRYWAATGCLILGKAAAPAADALDKLLDDPFPVIRFTAADALITIGKPGRSLATLGAALAQPLSQENANWLANLIRRHNLDLPLHKPKKPSQGRTKGKRAR